MQKIYLILLGFLIPLFLSATSNNIIYEEPKIEETSDEVIINRVEILNERSNFLEIKIHYNLLTKDRQKDIEIWVSPNHSDSVFEWTSVKAYSGKNTVNLEMNLKKDVLKELGIQSVNSEFLRVFIDLRSDHWFKKEIPFTKQWTLN
ncbi:hypothetical protein OO007_18920 [Cocleimonas sp. KMM 6892]|uniref:hypothetical protein n=1 Tax=unclassified Cocleimonas TaxID=2639732 RepID=UPI002DB9086C|nr:MULTISPECIES: hypothetical protein [unclassified Cocleimonas]MEB8434318.1 hypothetical protein [Cocleimonas sp. KMM 6892]MEC4717279.1 hypothetical protein [Cocleimonas sp. KMM 6895]MEC4746658.1 hypothetical protein [Cocleimonas sp. KMM 6896]